MGEYKITESRRYILKSAYDTKRNGIFPTSEKEYINTIDVEPTTPILDRNDLRLFVVAIYPEIVSRLPENSSKLGVRINTNDTLIKCIVHGNDNLNSIQKRFLSRYVATVELGHIFNGRKNTPPTK